MLSFLLLFLLSCQANFDCHPVTKETDRAPSFHLWIHSSLYERPLLLHSPSLSLPPYLPLVFPSLASYLMAVVKVVSAGEVIEISSSAAITLGEAGAVVAGEEEEEEGESVPPAFLLLEGERKPMF